MKLVNVVKRHRYQKDLTEMIKLIAPDLLSSQDKYAQAIERMYQMNAISRGEKTFYEIKLQGKLICLMIENIFKEHGYETYATVNFIDKENKAPGTVGTLVHLSGPHMPEEYVEAIDGLELTEFTGACGRSAAVNKIVHSVDALHDELYKDFWPVLTKYNLQSVSSFPIHVDNEICGTVAVFSQSILDVSSAFLEEVQQRILDLELVFARLQEDWKNRDAICWKYLLSNDMYVHYADFEPVEKYLGWTPEDVIGAPLLESFVHPDDWAETKNKVKQVFEEHRAKRLIYRMKKKDGSYEVLEALLIPIITAGTKELLHIEVFQAINTKRCKEFMHSLHSKLSYIPNFSLAVIGLHLCEGVFPLANKLLNMA